MKPALVEPAAAFVETLAEAATICHNPALDQHCGTREGGVMEKTHIHTAVAMAATLILAACNTEPEVVQLNKDDPMADALKNAGPVAPPPMIQASRTYRCRDNSLYYVDFYTNDSAMVRTQQGGDPVAMLTAEGGTPPYVGQEGYSVSGNGEQVSISAPGRGSQTCHT